MKRAIFIVFAAISLVLAGCGTTKRGDIERAPSSGGGYYLDDGPGANAPSDIASIPDAVPKVEPLSRGTLRPYTVMGRDYTPMTELVPYKARGIASWYGRRYHGKSTSNGEKYDMYAMSAAHTILPIPSYARVTNISNGRSVVVRVNDRGPFIDNRLIDLSYSAAWKLGIINAGSGMVEVVSIIPGTDSDAVPPPVAVTAPPPPAPPAPPPVETPVAAIPLPPVAAPPIPAPTGPVATTAAGSYVQFGAFGVQTNAESYMTRLQAQAEWLSGSLRVHFSDGIYRVQAGPYGSEVAARDAAERAAQALGVKPVVIKR